MVKINITLPIEYNTDMIKDEICRALPITREEIFDVMITRRALDLSDKRMPSYKTTVAFSVAPDRENGLLKMRKKVSSYPDYLYTPPTFHGDFRPVVVGSGPAGLFAALTLAESGARPIVIERGKRVDERAESISRFERFGVLDPESNVQFGEGGAGTYSDGKLKVGGMDKYKMKILREFILSGATDDIVFSSTAHLGTDRLPVIVTSLREKIISLGGEFIFSARMTDIVYKNGKLVGITYVKGGEEITLDTGAAILAIGHSARDTLTMLYEKGFAMTAKNFGIGVRIEHPREYINKLVYGESSVLITETASYHLVTHLPNGRSVYSFCMCPGGSVVAAASDRCEIVTNGMSKFDRMADNSNAALLVSVTPVDFASDHPLAGIELQKMIEKAAFLLTNDYRAPATRLADFLTGQSTSAFGGVLPSYPRGVEMHDLGQYLPEYVTSSLRAAIYDFDSWMGGYNYGDAVLTGPETRTTSPVRIHRDIDGQARGFSGIYPAGEGAGYAGGIVSSAYDGIKAAENLISCFGIAEI